MPSRPITAEMPEANYLIGHPDGRYYRLLMRCFYKRSLNHASYVRTDELVDFVRQYLPYDEATCRQHLDQMEKWGLIILIPEQSKPANLMELRQKPRVYQASRIALRLEALRAEMEQEEGAASLDPAALDLLVQRVRELVAFIERDGLHRDGAAPDAHRLWVGVYESFSAFSRRVREYLEDLPRHRPREVLDYAAFRAYRDLLVPYLQEYARRLFDRREQMRVLLRTVAQSRELLATTAAAVEAQQVRADGSRPDFERQKQRFLREIGALIEYFGDQGDVDVLLERAQAWVSEITRHARRLSEQHLGGSVREQTLLDLARRFCDCTSLEQAEGLAQVVFAATLPLHWRGESPPPSDQPPWKAEPVTVPLQAVRRGQRPRTPQQVTADRSHERLQRMLEAAEERKRAARELAQLFGEAGELDLGDLTVREPRQRQLLLHLLYKSLSQQGPVGVGYRNWSVSAEVKADAPLGRLTAADGTATLPHVLLRLHKGGPR